MSHTRSQLGAQRICPGQQTDTSSRLLEVFDRLRDISAATSNESAQDELLERAKVIVQDICSEHIVAANSFVRDEDLKVAIKAEIENECRLLVEYLEVAKRFNLEINSRAKDRVVGFGEKLSCRFMTCLLKDRVCLQITHRTLRLANLSLEC